MTEPAKHRWHMPDVRGWATMGMFGLVAYVVTLAATIPALGSNELFKTLSILICGTGGFGLVCAFLWGGSKLTTHVAEAMAASNQAAIANGGHSPGSVTVEAPATISVETTEPQK